VPTYQYACTECGHAFDIVQSFSEDSLTVCPECSGRLRKVFNAVGVVFKGSGFYRTDSRGKTSASESSSDGAGSKIGSGDSSSSNGSTSTSDGASPKSAAPKKSTESSPS
jgi:putative FmdB family regulatory protein